MVGTWNGAEPGATCSPTCSGGSLQPHSPQHGHGWAAHTEGLPETLAGWKLKEDGNCLLFARKKYQMYPHRVGCFFFFGFFFRQLCLGLFVSEAGFLNHPKQTKRNGAMTRYPNKERFCWARFTPSSAHQSLYFPWHTSGGHSLATAPSLQHQLGTACLQASRCQISAP